MKSFKGYIKEAAPAWTDSLSNMLFDLPRSLKDAKIPLSPSIFKRVWPKPVRSRVFHLTDIEGVRTLKKMQGGKRSISAFYNINSSSIGDGIRTDGGYVVEMDADVLAASPDDIGSQPDKTGRRWLVLDTLTRTMGGASKLRGMDQDIENMMWGIIKTHAKFPELDWPIYKAWPELRTERINDKKVMSLIIRDYMDGIEKIMKNYSKPLKSIFTDYAFNKELVPDPDSGDFALWDEIVVNNFKIKKIHVSAEFSPDFEGDDDPLDSSDIGGFPFELYDDNGDMVDYIARTRN